MAAGIYDSYAIEQGVVFSEGFRCHYSNGMPMDLTGYTPHMQIRSSIEGILVLDLTSPTYTDYEDYVNGYFAIVIPAAVTALLPAGRYVYDIKMEHATTPFRLLEGSITVRGAVTR